CFFSIKGRHTRFPRDWSSDVCSSDLRTSRETLSKARVPGNALVTWRISRSVLPDSGTTTTPLPAQSRAKPCARPPKGAGRRMDPASVRRPLIPGDVPVDVLQAVEAALDDDLVEVFLGDGDDVDVDRVLLNPLGLVDVL